MPVIRRPSKAPTQTAQSGRQRRVELALALTAEIQQTEARLAELQKARWDVLRALRYTDGVVLRTLAKMTGLSLQNIHRHTYIPPADTPEEGS